MIDVTSIQEEIDRLLPTYKNFLIELVKLNSSYGIEKAAQTLVKNKMEELGLDVKAYHSRADEESINLVTVLKGSDPDYQSLILNAHCDVTPVDDIERWDVNPFEGKVIDNVLYARGAQDDKAGVAVILMIAQLLKNLNIQLKGDLLLQSVIEDETTGNGSKILVDNGYTADGVIICDGTWQERIIYGHLGQVWFDAEITGEPLAACHAGTRGVNPIYLGMDYIQKLKDWIEELNLQPEAFANVTQPFFVNTGSFHSGVWHGSIPSKAKIEFQIGFNHTYEPDHILKKVTEIAASISDRIQIRESILKTPAYKTTIDNPLISQLQTIIEKNIHQKTAPICVTGHADMRHFPTQNICLYGPGKGTNAHSINEHYDFRQMPQVTQNIMEFILKWCNEKKNHE